MPQYKQLARCFFKRARRGLFGGDRIRFGDQISEDGGNRCPPPACLWALAPACTS